MAISVDRNEHTVDRNEHTVDRNEHIRWIGIH